jgi:integrase
MPQHKHAETFQLYSADGTRKYLNQDERDRFLEAARSAPAHRSLFLRLLAWTGARVSEVLALTSANFQSHGIVALRTLKRRRLHMREVPVPPDLMQELEQHFGLTAAQRDPDRSHARLWPWHRSTAWRYVKDVMDIVGIGGVRACPKGLRHGFAIAALQSGIPLTLVSKWLGHSRLSTTQIYLQVCGAEELHYAWKLWRIQSDVEPSISGQRRLRDDRCDGGPCAQRVAFEVGVDCLRIPGQVGHPFRFEAGH